MKRRQRGVWPGLLSTERSNIWVAETLMTVEGNMNTLVKGERVPDPRCRRTQGRTYISRRDLGGLPAAQRHGRGRQREGRSRSEDAQQGEVRRVILVMKPANKAWRPTRRSWWSEGPHPRGNRQFLHIPDTGPGSCATRDGPVTATDWHANPLTSCALARPEGGAGCLSGHVRICAGASGKPGAYRDPFGCSSAMSVFQTVRCAAPTPDPVPPSARAVHSRAPVSVYPKD